MYTFPDTNIYLSSYYYTFVLTTIRTCLYSIKASSYYCIYMHIYMCVWCRCFTSQTYDPKELIVLDSSKKPSKFFSGLQVFFLLIFMN